MNAFDTSLLHNRPPRTPTPAPPAARTARFKTNFLNKFIRQNDISSLIQFGCGDGKLAQRLKVGSLIGVDPVPANLAQCWLAAAADPSRTFVADAHLPAGAGADLGLSVDVVHRLDPDAEFNAHLRALFDAARRYVVIHGRDAGPAWAATAPARRFTTHIGRFFRPGGWPPTSPYRSRPPPPPISSSTPAATRIASSRSSRSFD